MAKQQNKSQVDYEKAAHEWSDRIGSAKAQARNWMVACLLSMVLVILLLLGIFILIHKQKTYVYVAEVKPQDNIVNVHALDKAYVPTQAQQEYFIGKFIRQIMTLPLDPVVARENWLNAYTVVEGKALSQLNAYARANDPFKEVGLYTKVVKIQNYHPISNNSYDFTWTQTVYDAKGIVKSNTLYNGIFTVSLGHSPKTMREMLDNPFGLKLAYFTFTNEGRSS